MGNVVAEVLPLAIAVAASPFPIVPAILLLFTPRARATSLGFLAGWVLGIAVATTAFTVLAKVIETREESPTWASWARVAVGAALVVLAVRQWLGRRDQDQAPAWMQALDGYTPARAVRLGVLLSAANPKVLLLAAGAGIAIGSAELSRGSAVGAVALFTAVAAATVAIPVLLYALLGERMLQPLGVAKDWLEAHNAAVMAVVIGAIGVALLSDGISGL